MRIGEKSMKKNGRKRIKVRTRPAEKRKARSWATKYELIHEEAES